MIRRDALPVVLLLSLVGVLMGAGSLTGAYGPPIEFGLWTVAAAALWVPLGLARLADRPVLHLSTVGVLAGVWTGAIQAAFAATLVANNPGYVEPGATATAAVRAMLFVSAVLIGLVWGALWGLVLLGLARVRARRASLARA